MTASHPLRAAFAALVALAAVAAGLLVPGSAEGARSTPLEFPRRPLGMKPPGPVGRTVDQPAGYQGQEACAVAPMRGIVKLRRLALHTYKEGYGSAYVRSCTSGSTSEHKDGRAWDWMLDVKDRSERRAAAHFLGWLTADGGENARRLGIMYVIYNRRSWASYDPQWESYSGYDPHTNHIHISLSWNGARAHTSFWTGRTWSYDYGSCQVFDGHPARVITKNPRTKPCPDAVPAPRVAPGGRLWIGSSGSKVRRAERLLDRRVTGVFDAATRTAVLRYQRRHDLPTTGAVDAVTWASLNPAKARGKHLDWRPREAARFGNRNLDGQVLHRGSAGLGTYALQVALRLRVPIRNGYFGRRTAGAVKRFKSAHGLAPNSRVNQRVWAELTH